MLLSSHEFALPYSISSSTSLFTTSLSSVAGSSSTMIAASVPPPGSKLYRLRSSASSSSGGGNPASRKRGRTDLRYATHYASGPPSAVAASQQEEHDDGGGNGSQRNHLFPLNPSNQGSSVDGKFDESSGNHTNHNKLNVTKIRKRARMMKFIDRRFSRLQFKSSKSLKATSSSPGKTTTSSSEQAAIDYQKRKEAWAAKYTSVSTLRSTFGKNKNRLWGDFDPATTRKLYHTLIPRALLALHDMGLSNVDELAPLAYQARVAAKKYARERSRLPGRIGSMMYDGFRQWRRYGKWETNGMTWEQVWRKYEDQILREAMMESGGSEGGNTGALEGFPGLDLEEEGMFENADLDDEQLTARICLRILERSVVTNEAIDKLFLKRLVEGTTESEGSDLSSSSNISMASTTPIKRRKRHERQRQRKLQIQADLQAIEKKFDDDIRELLKHTTLTTTEGDERRSKRKMISSFLTGKDDKDDTSSPGMPADATSFARGGGGNVRGAASPTSPTSEADLAAAMFSMTEITAAMELDYTTSDQPSNTEDAYSSPKSERSSRKKSSIRKLAVHEVFALRLLASTKQRIAALQSLPQFTEDDDEDNTYTNKQ